MSILRRDDTVTNTLGNAIAGAKVYYLEQPADVSALTPLAAVYADMTGTPVSNPQESDGFGHVVAYLNSGVFFTVVYVYPNGSQQVYADQFVGGTPGNNLTPVQVSTGAGTITGAIPGSTFTLPSSPMANTIILQANGQVLTLGLGYNISGVVVTLARALQSGDNLAANYFI
jgi:hypothetical protein